MENPQQIQDQLLQELGQSTAALVPLFFSQMPKEYFSCTCREEQQQHLRALLAMKSLQQERQAPAGSSSRTSPGQELLLSSDNGARFTFISDRSFPGQLARIVRALPPQRPLATARIFTAKDGSFVVDLFDFRQSNSAIDASTRRQASTVLQEVARTTLSPEDFLAYCSDSYLKSLAPKDLRHHYGQVSALWGSDDIIVECEASRVAGAIEGPRQELKISIFGGNISRRRLFETAAIYFGTREIDIRSAQLESIKKQEGQAVSLLTWIVHCNHDLSAQDLELLRADLIRLSYIDDLTLEVFAQRKWALTESELVVTLCALAHQLLSKHSALLYTRQRILDTALRYPKITQEILERFHAKFNPSQPQHSPASSAISEPFELSEPVEYEEERKIFLQLAEIVERTLKTNYFLPGRYALGLRLEAELLQNREPIFGLYFVHGRGFDGLHLRFREIARGGIRIVLPRDKEQYLLESERQLQECYALAYAQQLKNKDIPEGGAKAVVLTRPGESSFRCGKAFSNTLLELLTTRPQMRSYLGAEEVLYFGPDENVSNQLIEWIVQRAAQLGYRMPTAVMSSKPGAGINHKQYGVTSEGVIVFLTRALKELGIDPECDSFSVKLTGGPDGDVAGNALRILLKRFGARCKIVGISDASGCADDPRGLDPAELLRLVQASLPIAQFNSQLLSAEGRCSRIEDPDGFTLRAQMHNRVRSDAFIPAGGRPETINDSNWRKFLLESGQPSSRVIVEGANLFLTPGAREKLCKAGVMIIKDSSANKCGVICSSFEVIASMLLSTSEFLEVKEHFVAQVIEKLRSFAELEAEAMFREARFRPEVSLPQISAEISHAINRAADAIATELGLLADQATLLEQVVYDHLPSVLHPFARERLYQCVPAEYLQRIIASSLASRIVYQEGLTFFSSLEGRAQAQLALRYFQAQRKVASLLSDLKDSSLQEKQQIETLLINGGARALLFRS
jgi:glutamate dehydrogenase